MRNTGYIGLVHIHRRIRKREKRRERERERKQMRNTSGNPEKRWTSVVVVVGLVVFTKQCIHQKPCVEVEQSTLKKGSEMSYERSSLKSNEYQWKFQLTPSILLSLSLPRLIYTHPETCTCTGTPPKEHGRQGHAHSRNILRLNQD